MYSPGNDKLTEVLLYMSTSCQPGSRVIRAFSDVDKPFLLSTLAFEATVVIFLTVALHLHFKTRAECH